MKFLQRECSGLLPPVILRQLCPWCERPCWKTRTELADTFVDISNAMDIKVKAVMAHRSQIGERSESEVMGFIKDRAQDAGKSATEPYQLAEAFRKVTFRT